MFNRKQIPIQFHHELVCQSLQFPEFPVFVYVLWLRNYDGYELNEILFFGKNERHSDYHWLLQAKSVYIPLGLHDALPLRLKRFQPRYLLLMNLM